MREMSNTSQESRRFYTTGRKDQLEGMKETGDVVEGLKTKHRDTCG